MAESLSWGRGSVAAPRTRGRVLERAAAEARMVLKETILAVLGKIDEVGVLGLSVDGWSIEDVVGRWNCSGCC